MVLWAIILVALGTLLHQRQRGTEAENNVAQLDKLHQFFVTYAVGVSATDSDDWAEVGEELADLAAPWDAQVAVFDAAGQVLTGDDLVAPEFLNRQNTTDAALQKILIDETFYLTRLSQLSPLAGSSDVEQPPVLLRTVMPIIRRSGIGGDWFWPTLFLLWLLPALAWGIMLRRITLPIELMSTAFQDVRRGNFDVRVEQLSHRKGQWAEHYMQFRRMQKWFQRRQDAMHDSNQRFEAMLASMAEGVMAINSEGKIILANRAVRNMLMLTPTNIIGRRLRDLVRIPELLKVVEAAGQTGSFQKAEFKTLHQPRRVIDVRLTSLDNDDNNGVGIAIVFQDVTELRALESMRRDFVANVSHELKTPLASIKAYAETLRLGAINDQEKNLSFVEQIEAQAELLHLQIQDLMVIARVESGNLLADLEPVWVNQACSDCVNQLFDLARISEIELKIELSREDPAVMASNEGLVTILNNLITNAIHYTPPGRDVLVKTWQDGADAVIEVVDTGIGIGKSHQDRVFERFYRVDKARSRDIGGTGLGLAIVKHTVQAFDGRIKLESDIGKGTKFEIRFPLLNT